MNRECHAPSWPHIAPAPRTAGEAGSGTRPLPRTAGKASSITLRGDRCQQSCNPHVLATLTCPTRQSQQHGWHPAADGVYG